MNWLLENSPALLYTMVAVIFLILAYHLLIWPARQVLSFFQWCHNVGMYPPYIRTHLAMIHLLGSSYPSAYKSMAQYGIKLWRLKANSPISVIRNGRCQIIPLAKVREDESYWITDKNWAVCTIDVKRSIQLKIGKKT